MTPAKTVSGRQVDLEEVVFRKYISLRLYELYRAGIPIPDDAVASFNRSKMRLISSPGEWPLFSESQGKLL
jgi:hypothetical protein